jgi:hypothetical protein
MVFFGGMCRLDSQYLAPSMSEAKCTRLVYGTSLSRLHTLDHPLALAFSKSSHLATTDPKQEINQGTTDKS